jgi:hypothetical protein
MNRTRLFAALLGVIFLSAVGIGFVIGDEERPMTQVASTDTIVATTTTTVARTTTTRAPATTTSTTVAPAPATTAAPSTTVRRPVVTIAPSVTVPPTTEAPPVTEPPTTTTTAPAYDPIKCAEINASYDSVGQHDNPDRVSLLRAFHCPVFYEQ